MPSPIRIKKPNKLVTFVVPALFAAAAVGCGGDSKPPPAKPEPTVAPTTPPAPTTTPTAEPEKPPTDKTAKPDASPPPPPPASSERPPVLLSDEKELSAAVSSSPGAKFELGDDTGRAIFRIREGALSSAHIFTFKLEPKGKSTGIPLGGRIYRLIVQVENSTERPKLDTVDKPFEFTLPTDKKKDVNLAIGEVSVDGKGNEKIAWTVVAPEKIDESMGTAFFKLNSVGNYYLHATLKAVSPPAPAK